MPKNLMDMNSKYVVKYDGTNVTTKLTAVQPIMQARYEAAQSAIYNAVETVRSILSDQGIPGTLWAGYLAFGEQIAKLTFSFKGLALAKEVSAKKAKFVTAYNLDPKILDAIAAAITGGLPAY